MAKRKSVNFELIQREFQAEPYAILDEMRAQHEDLAEAQIVLAWREKLKSDKDGHLVLGKCVKISDLQKELAEWDFVILLNHETWLFFSADWKRALMDHELCHAAPSLDEEGDVKRDERGRVVWRCRKHDIEEFHDVVQRHGCYKSDLQRFAEEVLRKRAAPLLEDQVTAT